MHVIFIHMHIEEYGNGKGNLCISLVLYTLCSSAAIILSYHSHFHCSYHSHPLRNGKTFLYYFMHVFTTCSTI